MDDEESNAVEYQTVKSIRYNYATFSKPGQVTATVKERKIPVTSDILLNEDGSSRSVFVSSRPKIELPTNKILRVKRKLIKTTSEIDAKIRMPPPQFPPPRYRPITKSHVSLGSPAKLKPTLVPINTEEKAPSRSSSSTSTTTIGGGTATTLTNFKFIPFELSKCTPRKISPSDLVTKPLLPPLLANNNTIGEADSIESKNKRICVKTRKIYTHPKKPKLQPVFQVDSSTNSDNNNSGSIKSEIPKTISTSRLRKFVNSWALKLGRQCEKDELKDKRKHTNQHGPLISPYFSVPNQILFAQQQQFSAFSNNSGKVPITKASVKEMSAPNDNDDDDETFIVKKMKMSNDSTTTNESIPVTQGTSSNLISSSTTTTTTNTNKDVNLDGIVLNPSMKRTREECSQDLSDISSPSKKLKTTTIKIETVSSALDKDGKLSKNQKSKTNKHNKKKKKNKLKNKLNKMKKTDSMNVNNNDDGVGATTTTFNLQSSIDETLSNDVKSTKYNAADLKPSSSQSQSPGDSNSKISSRLLNIRKNLNNLANGISSQQGTSSDNNNDEAQPLSARWSPQLIKTKLEPSPLVMHTIKLLQQKRELQVRLEDPESNTMIKLSNAENEQMVAPVSHKGELLLNNVPMDAGEVKNVIMKRLAINLAHEGFTHSKLQPLEVLGDVVHDFYFKMTTRLKQIRERELAGVDHGFPDPMERVLVELGMGGVRGLESFYKSKVINYEERMVDQVNQMKAHMFQN